MLQETHQVLNTKNKICTSKKCVYAHILCEPYCDSILCNTFTWAVEKIGKEYIESGLLILKVNNVEWQCNDAGLCSL